MQNAVFYSSTKIEKVKIVFFLTILPLCYKIKYVYYIYTIKTINSWKNETERRTNLNKLSC